jgi:hypothetical protein
MQFLPEPAGDFPDGQQRFRLGHGRVPFPWAGCRIFRIRHAGLYQLQRRIA